MIQRIDHVSIAVRDPSGAREFYRNILGAVPGARAEDPRMKYTWEIFSVGDLSRLELLGPTADGSFLDGFLKGREGGVHHITMQTPDIKNAMRFLDAQGIPYFGYREYAEGVWKEIFIHPRDAFGVLVQIAEFAADDWLSETVKLPRGRRWEAGKTERGVSLTLTHPGGGTMRFELDREEAHGLVEELGKML